MKIGQLVRVCPGGRHAWYETDKGYPIRKPIGFDLSAQDIPRRSLFSPITQGPKQPRLRHFGIMGFMAAAITLEKVPFWRRLYRQGKRG